MKQIPSWGLATHIVCLWVAFGYSTLLHIAAQISTCPAKNGVLLGLCNANPACELSLKLELSIPTSSYITKTSPLRKTSWPPSLYANGMEWRTRILFYFIYSSNRVACEVTDLNLEIKCFGSGFFGHGLGTLILRDPQNLFTPFPRPFPTYSHRLLPAHRSCVGCSPPLHPTLLYKC